MESIECMKGMQGWRLAGNLNERTLGCDTSRARRERLAKLSNGGKESNGEGRRRAKRTKDNRCGGEEMERREGDVTMRREKKRRKERKESCEGRRKDEGC